ncbi:MAG: radical SAM protein, partial [Bacteroidota bacterium]
MNKTDKQFKLSCDLFQLDYKNNKKLLYAPRLGYACVVNDELINLLCNQDEQGNIIYKSNNFDVLQELEYRGVLNDNIERKVDYIIPKEYKPLNLTLFPTNQCNLACTYCYASAGEAEPIHLSFEKAKTAIDFVFNNIIEAGHPEFELGFHGGGEPLLRWSFVKECVDYTKQKCKEKNIKLVVGAATNGILSEEQLNYIFENFSSLNISFDGDEISQNINRPFPNGQGSFDVVSNTIKKMGEANFPYGIRCTITAKNLDGFVDSMRFMVENYQPFGIHLEPVRTIGRCTPDSGQVYNLGKFKDIFIDCEEIANKHKINIIFSGCRMENLSGTFCGVSKDNLVLTHEGKITSCFEITSIHDPRSETFFVGEIDDNLNIKIFQKNREYLHSLKVNNLKYCRDCFAKWHCAGD